MPQPGKSPVGGPAGIAPTRSEAEAAIARLGEIGRELQRIDARKSETVARAASEAEEKAKPLNEERPTLEELVRNFCDANRSELTGGGQTKTVAFPTGEVSWRSTKGKVIIDKTPPVLARIMDRLRKLGGFIRTKEEIDVAAIGDALRKDRKAPVGRIDGIVFEEPAETFSIAPVELPLAPAAAA